MIKIRWEKIDNPKGENRRHLLDKYIEEAEKIILQVNSQLHRAGILLPNGVYMEKVLDVDMVGNSNIKLLVYMIFWQDYGEIREVVIHGDRENENTLAIANIYYTSSQEDNGDT